MLFVIDTSSLIALKALDWLNLVQSSQNEFIWPSRVTQELRQQKAKNKKILDLLASGEMREELAQNFFKFEGISDTDSEVICLAAERNAFVVSEDVLLRHKAIKHGLSAVSIATLLVLLHQNGLLPKEECLARLNRVYEEKLLSRSEYHQLVQGVVT